MPGTAIPPRRRLRLLTAVLVFCISAELLGLAAHYIATGTLFYLHPKAYQPLLPAPEDRLVVQEAIHPYFGPTHTPGAPFEIPPALRVPNQPAGANKTNNFGFVSRYDYPVQKTRANQFIIGLFGGSVGVWFCEIGAPRLLEQLKRDPFFRDKELISLCFSHEGYKQPQEALVLAYFLSIGQTFDMAINLDGFNDAALGALNAARGFDISMPSVQHLDLLINLIHQSTLTPEKLDLLAEIFRNRRRLVALEERIQRNRSAAVNLVLDRYYERILDQYTQQLGRFSALPSNPRDNALVQVTRPVKARTDAELFSDIATNWARSSILMRDLLAVQGAAYYHVLQPNQYYRTARAFSASESATALNEASPYTVAIEHGYPALVRAAATELMPRHVAFFDASAVFDREKSAVYLDNCCHYTHRGNMVLADFIAASVLQMRGRGQGAGGP